MMSDPTLYFEINLDHRGRRVCRVPQRHSGYPLAEQTTLPLHACPEAVIGLVQSLYSHSVLCWLWDPLTSVMLGGRDVLILIGHLPQIEQWTQGLPDADITKLFAENDILDAIVKTFIERRQNDPCSEICQGIWQEILTTTRAHFPGADDTWVIDFAASLLVEHGLRTNHGERRERAKSLKRALFAPHPFRKGR